MSAKLTKALEFANYRTTLNNQQDALRAKVTSLLSYSVNGGTFTIDQSLIAFVKLLIDDKMKEAVLLDIYNNPINVELAKFYTEIKSRYFEAMNDYHAQYQTLKRARKVSRIVDIVENGED